MPGMTHPCSIVHTINWQVTRTAGKELALAVVPTVVVTYFWDQQDKLCFESFYSFYGVQAL
jgi:hypothetical protein